MTVAWWTFDRVGNSSYSKGMRFVIKVFLWSVSCRKTSAAVCGGSMHRTAEYDASSHVPTVPISEMWTKASRSNASPIIVTTCGLFAAPYVGTTFQSRGCLVYWNDSIAPVLKCTSI